MTAVVATIVSIFALAGAAWAAGRLLRFSLCPICTGVAGTWLWMVAARELGFATDPTILAILLGGSAVGIAYLLEKRLARGGSALLWKTLFIPAGFAAAYGLAAAHWPLLAGALLMIALLITYFLWPRTASATSSSTVQELENKMKNCC